MAVTLFSVPFSFLKKNNQNRNIDHQVSIQEDRLGKCSNFHTFPIRLNSHSIAYHYYLCLVKSTGGSDPQWADTTPGTLKIKHITQRKPPYGTSVTLPMMGWFSWPHAIVVLRHPEILKMKNKMRRSILLDSQLYISLWGGKSRKCVTLGRVAHFQHLFLKWT